MAIQKPSTTSVAVDAPIVIYSNSPEIADLNPNYIKVIPGNVVGPIYLSSSDISSDEIDVSISIAEDSSSEQLASSQTSSVFYPSAPFLSDIEMVSNNVAYDAAGNPSVELVFKVKNSSGQTLKGINARVELK
jgi:hypothetical protein